MELQLQPILPHMPDRPADGHKGSFGKVVIVGGSANMIGAPAFAALAALRMGCGLAYIVVERSVLPFVLTVAPESVGVPVGGGSDDLDKALAAADAVVVGPGLGCEPSASQLLGRVMRVKAPMVLDADGLNLVASGSVGLERARGSTVMTPHPGEMKRLARLFGTSEVGTDEAARLEIASKAARYFQQIVVLKGHRTVITDGVRYAINKTGDSTLAKGGSGDVLSGMIGTLLAQGMEPFEAAWLGCHLHGKVGEEAGRVAGCRSALTRDLINAISRVVNG